MNISGGFDEFFLVEVVRILEIVYFSFLLVEYLAGLSILRDILMNKLIFAVNL